MSVLPRLGVNIDHVATLRQLRGTPYPDLYEAARICERAGAEQITVHLREDRRHIQDDDVKILRKKLKIALNLEMAMTDEMVAFAKKIRPDWVCLVPEKRAELTTEGGLNLERNRSKLSKGIHALTRAGIKVSLFIEPSVESVEHSIELGADAVELHTGRYCLAAQKAFGKKSLAIQRAEFKRIEQAAHAGIRDNIAVHAGHGFDEFNVRPVAALVRASGEPLIEEYNIGHAIVCRAVLVGLERAVREMVSAICAP